MMANPTGINQYTKGGGNRVKARGAQASAKARHSANTVFAKAGQRALKAKTINALSLFNKAAAGFRATSTVYRKQ